MTEIENNQTEEQHILITQVRTLYESTISLIMINLAVSISLTYAYWDIISHTALVIWMSMMLLYLIVRAVIYSHFKNNFDPIYLTRYKLFLIIGSAFAGLLWGASGILLFPAENFDYQLFILLALLAMTGGSTFSLSIYLPTYFVFAPFVLLPIAIQLLLIGDSAHISMAAVTIIFLAALTSFNIRLNRTFKESLQLRFQNLELIEKLQEQKHEADQANSSKSKFLAAASHDLRQPLYVLNLFTAVLDELTNEPKVQKVVGQINLSVKSLQTQFDALLDISQLDAGVLNTDKSDFFLQDLLDKLANDFNIPAKEKGLKLIWELCPHAVHSEPNLLEQILRNFLSNAIRYTQQGEVRVSCSANKGFVTINIADTGLGIPEEAQQEIFTEFHQLNNSERDRSKGLGLGLSIVDRAAKLLGHPISVKSKLGKGSVFSVTTKETTMQQPSVERSSKSKTLRPKDLRLMIAVIDDEASIRDGISHLLELWGHAVITADSGSQILEKLQQLDQQPNVILSDFRLRNNETGITVISAIRDFYHHNIPALIITGDIEKERLIEIDKEGLDVLHKPVAPARLRAFLRSIDTLKMSA